MNSSERASTASAITDEQLAKLAADHLTAFCDGGYAWFENEVGFARAVLALAAPTAQPVVQAEGETPIDDKAHPRFLAGYTAGLYDQQLEIESGKRAAVEPSQPAPGILPALVALKLKVAEAINVADNVGRSRNPVNPLNRVALHRIVDLQIEIERDIDALASTSPAPAAPSLDALRELEARKDAAYLERNQVVAALASAFPSGTKETAIEGWSEAWHGAVYIDLPTGQASWHYHDSQAGLFAHLPPYQGEWDGHTTEQKYRRLAALSQEGDTK